MTVQDMIIAIYEGLGEPSDLCPYTDINDPATFDITTNGAQKILSWINRGYKRITSWKFPDGSQIRFNVTRNKIFLTLDTETLDVSSGSNESITLANSLPADDYLNDITFKITDGTGEGQIGLIIDSTSAGVLTVYPKLETALDNTSKLTIYPRNIRITDNTYKYKIDKSSLGDIYSLLEISDIKYMTPLAKLGRTDSTIVDINTFGPPTAWGYDDETIQFNSNIDDYIVYQIKYYKVPDDLSQATDEPQIPSAWHEAIVLWCLWWGYKRNMETDAAYSTKRDLIDFMQTTKQQLETSFELEDGTLSIQY